MTTEEKAKAYDEALERAKSFQEKFGGDYAGYIFPELAESEDELIRKRLINLIKELAANKEAIHTEGYFVDGQDKKYIAYLEKQKEQKPVEEINIDALLTADRLASAEMTGRLKERNEILKSPDKYGLQQPAEWSEEDENMIRSLILGIDKYAFFAGIESKKIINFLKSLRPQPHWKPSEKQMQALNEAKNEFECSFDWDSLDSLYDDLQKLL